MKLGLRGSTVVFGSRDSGVASREGPCLGLNEDVFVPFAIPACPYVTGVGSTVLPVGSAPGDPEVVTQYFSPGGGFSNVHTRPEYQKAAVER